MSNVKIYSVETRNIRRGEAELDILGETEYIIHIGQIAEFNKCLASIT